MTNYNEIKQELLDKAVREGWPDWKTQMYLYLHAPTKENKMRNKTDNMVALHEAEDFIACLRAEIERLHTLNEQQKFLVAGIVEAITNRGSHPDYHDRTLNKQRRLHPTLWNYLDKLVQSTRGTTLTNRAKWEKRQND